jgi:hypothetical protein
MALDGVNEVLGDHHPAAAVLEGRVVHEVHARFDSYRVDQAVG